MALTYSQYVGDGSTRAFAVTFPYISKNHVKVRVDGTIVPFTWITSATVQLNSAPTTGAIIDVRRETPNTEALVDFHDGSTLVESDLDLSTIQSLYIAQELVDGLSSKLGIDTDGAINTGNRRIKNVAPPLQPTDAANRDYVDAGLAAVPPQVTAAKNYSELAQAQAQIAIDKAGVATTKATEAVTSASQAAASAILAGDYAASVNPTNYYLKTAFKADGTANAPALYDGAGGFNVSGTARIRGPANAQQRLEFWGDSALDWIFYRDIDGSIALYQQSNGTAWRVDHATNKINFTALPTIAGNLDVAYIGADGKLPAYDGSKLVNLPAGGLGLGQYLQTVTGSRAANVVYQNPTDKPMFVSVTFTAANGSTGFYSLMVGETSSPAIQVGGIGSTNGSTQNFNICGIVPPRNYYKVQGSGPAMVVWTEMRSA